MCRRPVPAYEVPQGDVESALARADPQGAQLEASMDLCLRTAAGAQRLVRRHTQRAERERRSSSSSSSTSGSSASASSSSGSASAGNGGKVFFGASGVIGSGSGSNGGDDDVEMEDASGAAAMGAGQNQSRSSALPAKGGKKGDEDRVQHDCANAADDPN